MNSLITKYLNDFSFIHYKKDELIRNEGSLCSEIGIIQKGEAEIYTTTYDEHSFMIQILKEDDLFGGYLIFSSHPYYPGYIVATKECDVVFISKEKFLDICGKDQEFLISFLSYLSKQHILLQNRMKTLNQKTIRDKIMFYLLSESKKRKTKKIMISSKEELAKFLNIPRPSLSRELMLLKQDGIIEYKRKFIFLKK